MKNPVILIINLADRFKNVRTGGADTREKVYMDTNLFSNFQL